MMGIKLHQLNWGLITLEEMTMIIEIGKKEFSLKSGLKLYTSIYEELSK